MRLNPIGLSKVGLSGSKIGLGQVILGSKELGSAQNYQKRDIEFWAAPFEVAVKNWSND